MIGGSMESSIMDILVGKEVHTFKFIDGTVVVTVSNDLKPYDVDNFTSDIDSYGFTRVTYSQLGSNNKLVAKGVISCTPSSSGAYKEGLNKFFNIASDCFRPVLSLECLEVQLRCDDLIISAAASGDWGSQNCSYNLVVTHKVFGVAIGSLKKEVVIGNGALGYKISERNKVINGMRHQVASLWSKGLIRS